MNTIVAEIWSDEIVNKTTTVKMAKVKECQLRFEEAGQKVVSVSSIKSTVWQILKGKRKLYTSRQTMVSNYLGY